MNNTITQKQRDIGPELLRIIAMFMIIGGHIVSENSWDFSVHTFNTFILSSFNIGLQIGNVIFVLITGYYAVKSKATYIKAFRLIAETIFYSVLTYLVSCAAGANMFRPKYIFYALLPLISNRSTWFITVYLLLYALIPLLNAGISRLTQRQHLMIMLLFLFAWSILPNTYGTIFTLQNYGFTHLGMFVLLYMLGAYLRLYPGKTFNRPVPAFIIMVISGIIMLIVRIPQVYEFRTDVMMIDLVLHFVISICSDASLRGPFVLLFAVFSLILFNNFRFRAPKILYLISGSTFGVYLIHDSAWLRRYIWDGIFRLPEKAGSPYLILWALLTILIIFTVCSAVEILRRLLIEKPLFNSKLFSRASKAVEKTYNRVTDKMKIIRNEK